MITKPLLDALEDIERRTDKATMYALREIGRKFKQAAAKRAPVYKGQSGARVQMKMGQFNRFKKATGYKGSVANSVVVSGLLKGSISSSRKLKSVKTGEYSVKVGPRGQRVHLYAGKVEDRQAYIRPAYEAVLPQMVEIHAQVWARVNEKRG